MNLTTAQRSILRIITANPQRAPTVREIAKRYGCQINAAACHLKALERRGFIRKQRGARGIIVVDDAIGWTLWGPVEIGA